MPNPSLAPIGREIRAAVAHYWGIFHALQTGRHKIGQIRGHPGDGQLTSDLLSAEHGDQLSGTCRSDAGSASYRFDEILDPSVAMLVPCGRQTASDRSGATGKAGAMVQRPTLGRATAAWAGQADAGAGEMGEGTGLAMDNSTASASQRTASFRAKSFAHRGPSTPTPARRHAPLRSCGRRL
eukprot:scaffold146_cov265-Pinguiococcus_pyrenoidosus.AAC.5